MRTAQQHLDRACTRHLLDVCTGGKGFLIAGQHDGAYRRVLTHLGEIFRKGLAHFNVQRIARVGAIDAYQAHAIGWAFGEHYRFGHDIPRKQ